MQTIDIDSIRIPSRDIDTAKRSYQTATNAIKYDLFAEIGLTDLLVRQAFSLERPYEATSMICQCQFTRAREWRSSCDVTLNISTVCLETRYTIEENERIWWNI